MDVPSHADVVEQIDSFLARHEMAPTRLGRDALSEPQFVRSVKEGRVPTLAVLTKLFAFMRKRDEEVERSAIDADRTRSGAATHRLNAGAR